MTLKDEAWGRILEATEWFDGEPEITASAEAAFEREWAENAPSRLTIRTFGRTAGSTTHMYFPNRVAAEEAVSVWSGGNSMATIIPVSRVMVADRGFVPPQYHPAKWPESRW